MKVYIVLTDFGDDGKVILDVFRNKTDAEAYKQAEDSYYDVLVEEWAVRDSLAVLRAA